jgi:hypothetical protein
MSSDPVRAARHRCWGPSGDGDGSADLGGGQRVRVVKLADDYWNIVPAPMPLRLLVDRAGLEAFVLSSG